MLTFTFGFAVGFTACLIPLVREGVLKGARRVVSLVREAFRNSNQQE